MDKNKFIKDNFGISDKTLTDGDVQIEQLTKVPSVFC